jgi:hypothetical protein
MEYKIFINILICGKKKKNMCVNVARRLLLWTHNFLY